MGRNNGILLPGQGMPAPVGQMMISSPFNDTQLVALMAAELQAGGGTLTLEESVGMAVELVALSVMAIQSGALAARVRALAAEANPAGPQTS